MGDTYSVVFEEWGDTVYLGGRNSDGIWEIFEDKAVYLLDWCERKNFILHLGEEEVEFGLEEQ